MKALLIAVAVLSALVVTGCGSSPADEGTVKPGNGVALNPSGKPQGQAQEEMAAGMQKTGNAMNDAREKAAKAEAAARQKSGGK